MPLTPPTLDDRKYPDLLAEALARIPVHNPAWTNFNASDPGVTLLELFAFLTESLLYRANQIPERNRRKFLTLLGVPVRPAAAARGLVTFATEKAGGGKVRTLPPGVKAEANGIAFYTADGLDVLPVEGRAFYKRKVADPPAAARKVYEELYASFRGPGGPTQFELYETVPFPRPAGPDVELGRDTVDGCLWFALLVPEKDAAEHRKAGDLADYLAVVRTEIGGKVVSLGVVPRAEGDERRLAPPSAAGDPDRLIEVQVPCAPPGGNLPAAAADRVACYRTLPAAFTADVLAGPGLVTITLPDGASLKLWANLDPLEAGAGDFPPGLDDTDLGDRVVTWVRLRLRRAVPGDPAAKAKLTVVWAGINAAEVGQRTRVTNELLRRGTGEPDQVIPLAARNVLPGSVRLRVTPPAGKPEDWTETDDLLAAGPEVPSPDPKAHPGTAVPLPRPDRVFALDPEAGELRFGTGLRGRRPPRDAALRADYDTTAGAAGNVGPGQVTAVDGALGVTVTNPVRTWGGGAAEPVADAERLVPRYVKHGDRLVTPSDFESITLRTPGADVGRVDVLSATAPAGPAAGAVTVLVVPANDLARPAAPAPDRAFLDAVCRHLDPRRLVTTEVYVRGPNYVPVWVSVGLEAVPGVNPGPVREAVRKAVGAFLHPLPADPADRFEAPPDDPRRGWPLRRPVLRAELVGVAARVPGVRLVTDVLVARDGEPARDAIPLAGLELPWLLGVAVGLGPPTPIEDLRGRPAAGPAATSVPIPIVPHGVLTVDANGTRFHLLFEAADWVRCPGVGRDDAPDGPAVVWDEERRDVRLRRKPFVFTAPGTGSGLTPEDRRGAARDRYGNWYWIDDAAGEVLVRSVGSGRVARFWHPGDGDQCAHAPGPDEFRPDVPAPPPAAVRLAGLAVTEHHYLVVGTTAPGGLLVFDLHATRPPKELRWPAGVAFEPFDLAPAPGGGVWVLDRVNRRYWGLDRWFAVAGGVAPGPAQEAFAPEAGDPRPADPPPVVADGSAFIVAGAAPVAIEGLPDGTVVILGRGVTDRGSLVSRYRFGTLLDGPVSLAATLGLADDAVPGHDLAFAGDRLFLVGSDGNQVFAFDVGTDDDGRLAVKAVRDGGYFPLRLFAGKALVAAGDDVYYDFADEWLPVRAQPRPLYVTEGVFESPVFDGRDPGCVWHRLMIDLALPPDTGLAVESRAGDDPDELTERPFDPEPTPYRRGTGSELPYLPPPPDRFGTWELLFQKARGRYLQLRVTMRGNGRATPRVRAVRAYYPRFSYLERYLPAAYRRCPDSAAFLDSFLANVEGTLTAIEDRVAAAQLLFDSRTAPAEALDWLAGWLGKVFDPAWDEGRRRLFLRHAAELFRWRGTVRGLVTALRLALDRCPDDGLFADGPGGWDAAGYRVAEGFRAGPDKAAHRFTVFLPVPVDRRGTDEEMQAARAWAARVVDGEKPAHTVFDVQFYWAAFRVGAAALGADTRIDRGSRFVPPRPGAVLGQAYLAEGVLAARPPRDAADRTILGRDPVAADPRRGPCR